MHPCSFAFALLVKFSLIHAYGVPFVKHFGEHCDWRGQSEICDQTRGLACSYQSETCDCWDVRKIFSNKVHRCVGKAGEECSYFETERLCTENAYCLEDRSLSPIPVCVCLKGYFRTDGSCIKYSKFGEPCEQYPPNRLVCEPDTGLKCYTNTQGLSKSTDSLLLNIVTAYPIPSRDVDTTCQCESDHIYDPVRDLCIANAGQKCSRSLNNCIENAECSEKTWALDHATGTTKLSGYRCVCKAGLKITETGGCASDYGGVCLKTSECFPGENLTCLNNICQCHPLSQIYDKRLRRCFNLVGTKCQSAPGTEIERGKNVNSLTKNTSRTNSKISLESSFTTNSNSSTTSSIIEEQEEMVGTEGAECISNSECVSTAHGSYCKCVNGSSETMIKTCLLDYGESCRQQMSNEIQSRTQIFVLEKEMKCNVFEGLICQSTEGMCLCADPSLVYDNDSRQCVARVSHPCGNLKLGMLDISQDIKDMIFINCEKNSTCLEFGMSKRVCVPFNKKGVADTAAGTSLSKLMFNNANVISATD